MSTTYGNLVYSVKARLIIGALAAFMGIIILWFPVMDLAGGAAPNLNNCSVLLLGVTHVFLFVSIVSKKYSMISAMVYFILLGPAIFMVSWSWDDICFKNPYPQAFSVVWAVLWSLTMGFFLHSYNKYKKQKFNK